MSDTEIEAVSVSRVVNGTAEAELSAAGSHANHSVPKNLAPSKSIDLNNCSEIEKNSKCELTDDQSKSDADSVIAHEQSELVSDETSFEQIDNISTKPDGALEVPNTEETPQVADTGSISKTEISGEASGSLASNDTSKTHTSGEAVDSQVSNDTSKSETSGEAPDSLASSNMPKAETSGEVPDSLASNDTPKKETSGEAPDSLASNNTPKAETSGEVPDSLASNDTSKKETSGEAPDSLASNDPPKAETSGEATDSLATNNSPKAETSGEATDSLATNNSPKAKTSGEASDSLASNDTPKKATSGEAPDSLASNDTPKAETSGEAQEEPVDIFGNGLLIKKIIRKAEKCDDRPNDGDACTIHIEVCLADGTLIDRLDNYNFFVGEHEVMIALDVGIKFMYIGEVTQFTTDAKYAYGEMGRKPAIPPNASLVFTVELVHVVPGVDHHKLSVGHRLSMGERKRRLGNEKYSRKDFATAIEVYAKAIDILDPLAGSFTEEPEILQKFLECRLKCFNNMSVCQMRLGYNEAAIKSAQEVLKVQPDNWKALGRMGKALGDSGNAKKAVEMLKKCAKLNTDDERFQIENEALLQVYIKKSAKETEKEKKMCAKMFGLQPTPEPPKVEEKLEKIPESSIFSRTWKWGLGGIAVALIGVAAFKYFHH